MPKLPLLTKSFFNATSLLAISLLAFPLLASSETTSAPASTSTLVLEGTDEQKGLTIAKATKQKNQGWQDSTGDMLMILRNGQGQESERHLRIKSLENINGGDKSLSVFDKPADIRNTKMLTYSNIGKADEQWLYLPALKRVKRISSKSKSGPFMGSEYAFEDLSSFEIEKYTFKYIGEQKVDGKNSYMIESYPNYEHSGYTKLITWIDKKELRPLKIEYYNRRNALLKTQLLGDYHLYLEKFWRAHKGIMNNHLTKKSTLLEWSNLKFKQGLKESDFNQNILKRVH